MCLKELFLLSLTVLYLTFVFLITTIARTPGGSRNYNISLFHTLREAGHDIRYSAKMIFFNLSLLFPMGVLLPAALEYRCRLWDILFLAFLVSFSIECTQYLFRLGLMETDDLIYNCTGAAAGYLLSLLLKWIFSRKRQAGGGKEEPSGA